MFREVAEHSQTQIVNPAAATAADGMTGGGSVGGVGNMTQSPPLSPATEEMPR